MVKGLDDFAKVGKFRQIWTHWTEPPMLNQQTIACSLSISLKFKVGFSTFNYVQMTFNR